MRAVEYTGYRHVNGCTSCDARQVCDGFYGDYVEMLGAEEASPISLAAQSQIRSTSRRSKPREFILKT